MRYFAIFAWAALAMASPQVALAFSSPTTITVTGQGHTEQPPDRASVNLNIITNDDDAKKAASDNTARYEDFKTRLTALGINPQAIRSTYYNVNFNPRPDEARIPMGAVKPMGQPAIASYPYQWGQRFGYVVNRTFSVELKDVNLVGKVVDTALEAGVTGVGGITYSVAAGRNDETSALAAAVTDARHQAEAIAAAAHLHIIRLRSIEAGGLARPMVYRTMSAVGSAPGPMPTNIAPSAIQSEASVTATYEVAP